MSITKLIKEPEYTQALIFYLRAHRDLFNLKLNQRGTIKCQKKKRYVYKEIINQKVEKRE
ncbi:hypothetical protein GCM10008921_22580 [Metaclostridioides mangenotii]